MCGIFSLFNIKNSVYTQQQLNTIENAFKTGFTRGPEYSILNHYTGFNSILGFHRLAINGLDEKSHQPISINKKILICNGEIYNYQEIYNTLNIVPKTNSDCESIIYAYEKYGIEGCLQLLDGVFSFILIDLQKKQMHVARDPFGVRPLYYYQGTFIDNKQHTENNAKHFFGYSSEMKMITNLNQNFNIFNIQQFETGSYITYQYSNGYWSQYDKFKYFSISTTTYDSIFNIDNALIHIRDTLDNAVLKRLQTTDRPVACLLSGGLDSSLITAIVSSYYKCLNKTLETYSIGLQGSEDLKYARIVADYLGTKHTEVIVTEQDFINAIPNVIYAIESYDTTTVRASVGNYLIAKYISQNSDAKVIFNGDGSDEVLGGYMYFHAASNPYEFDFECKRLLNDISYFDVLRSDRSISSNGLEPRTPFLDKDFVQSVFNISKVLRFNCHKQYCEKYILRKAFENTHILPKEILWRTKEAFSDGVSSQNRSWYVIIQEYIDKHFRTILDNYIDDKHIPFNTPDTYEKLYYRMIFHNTFGTSYDYVIPYFWMPRFVESNDASARTLDIYKKMTSSI